MLKDECLSNQWSPKYHVALVQFLSKCLQDNNMVHASREAWMTTWTHVHPKWQQLQIFHGPSYQPTSHESEPDVGSLPWVSFFMDQSSWCLNPRKLSSADGVKVERGPCHDLHGLPWEVVPTTVLESLSLCSLYKEQPPATPAQPLSIPIPFLMTIAPK